VPPDQLSEAAETALRHVAVPNRVRAVKRLVPPSVKAAGRTATRRYGTLTAERRVLPNFLVIGAKRSGTTSLWNWLLGHPGVLPLFPAVQQIKSPHYFDINWTQGERWYRSHFATERAFRRAERVLGRPPAVGEASPYYVFHPAAPERVAATTPDVKLVLLLRDPVRRAHSNFWERRGSGAEPLTSFREAIDAEPERLRGEEERLLSDPGYYSFHHDNHSYLARGRYVEQLERWLRHFPREQLLIERAEDLFRDAAGTCRRVEEFLDLPHAPDVVLKHHHKLPAPPLDDAMREELARYFRPHNEALYATLGVDFEWTVPRAQQGGPT
jgi:hypothetical protein